MRKNDFIFCKFIFLPSLDIADNRQTLFSRSESSPTSLLPMVSGSVVVEKLSVCSSDTSTSLVSVMKEKMEMNENADEQEWQISPKATEKRKKQRKNRHGKLKQVFYAQCATFGSCGSLDQVGERYEQYPSMALWYWLLKLGFFRFSTSKVIVFHIVPKTLKNILHICPLILYFTVQNRRTNRAKNRYGKQIETTNQSINQSTNRSLSIYQPINQSVEWSKD